MKFFILLCLLHCFICCHSQSTESYREIDRLALSIPALSTYTTKDISNFITTHFNTDNKKVRAIYTWVAYNITYSKDSARPVVFSEDAGKRITEILRRKKGVCESYALLFNQLCLESGLSSFMVEGFTKKGGFTDRSGHAWCVVFADGKWKLYDPTWDADNARRGLVSGNMEYDYFAQEPENFISTHIPFDPMFQLLNYPISFKEFSSGNNQSTLQKPFFNFDDSLAAYESMNELARNLSAAGRIEKNGIPNKMAGDQLNKLKMDIEIIYQDRDTTLYNLSVADYNHALSQYNSFINYRNNGFIPAKQDGEIQQIFNDVKKYAAAAAHKLKEISLSRAQLTLNTDALQKAIDDLLKHSEEQQLFLKNYLSNNLPGKKQEVLK